MIIIIGVINVLILGLIGALSLFSSTLIFNELKQDHLSTDESKVMNQSNQMA